MYEHIYIYVCVCVCVSIYMCFCMCVCVWYILILTWILNHIGIHKKNLGNAAKTHT